MRVTRSSVISIAIACLAASPATTARAQPDPTPAQAVEFTATFPWGPIVDGGTEVEQPDGTIVSVGFTARTTSSEASDPRFEGGMVYGCSELRYPAEQGTVLNCVFRIETDEGAWQMRPALEVDFPGDAVYGPYGVFTALFDGSGAYEGLTAVVEISEVAFEGYALHGLIIDTDLPPDVEPIEAEG